MTNNFNITGGSFTAQNLVASSGNLSSNISCSNHGNFGAAISTTQVQSDVGKLQSSIRQELNSSNTSFGRELGKINNLLNGIMEKMGVQAGGSKSCSSAGQMTDLVQEFADTSNQFKSKPTESINQVRDVLQQIQQLLNKLENTMHTDIKSQIKFQNRV